MGSVGLVDPGFAILLNSTVTFFPTNESLPEYEMVACYPIRLQVAVDLYWPSTRRKQVVVIILKALGRVILTLPFYDVVGSLLTGLNDIKSGVSWSIVFAPLFATK